jgi:hypothetical protein
MTDEKVEDHEVIDLVEPDKPLEPDSEPESTEPKKKEPRTYTQEDLDRITAKVKRTAKKNATEHTRKEVEAYYKGLGSSSKPEAKEEDKPPERTQFDSYEEFLDAKADYRGRKAGEKESIRLDHKNQENKIVEEHQKIFSNFQTNLREKYPDIDDRIETISDITMPEIVLQAIAESDVGPDILSHFSDNPKECERIAAFSPSKAVREIGKLEARFEVKTEPKKTPSKAPIPINPGGGGSPSNDTPSDSDDINEWMRKENARDRKKFGL